MSAPGPDDAGRPWVVLVGPPGSGKTTVGTLLAERLGLVFADTDAAVVERIGKPIAEMFVQEGEAAFRTLEREVVAEQLRAGHGVLALGGGSVLAAETRELLGEHRVVALDVDLADGMRRTGMSTARPLLAGVNPRATFRSLLADRAPLYAEVATVRVQTARRSPNQVVAEVLTAFGLPGEAADADPASADPHDRPTPRQDSALPSPGFGAPDDGSGDTADGPQDRLEAR
ncbi:shikimate kinase [Pseudonocardia sp. EC080610-09]|uniref:shikimate kinase n=1 Tax=unclassified Pseudonocardia TaxID=2619320 RepID=UPI00070589D8|nr:MULTISPECIES: shikimate kinase [unclassified Pseudonocardia]ALL76549.1 shikimate kinase [Pseudonocardia sp. EC080610-09]ALL83575.1 shikimate kinase [Pseudonocardia sp. EC080619-01]